MKKEKKLRSRNKSKVLLLNTIVNCTNTGRRSQGFKKLFCLSKDCNGTQEEQESVMSSCYAKSKYHARIYK